MAQKKMFMKPGYAIWLSALVYPGCGQFFQKRWLAASLIVLGFSTALGVAGGVVFQVMRTYYSLGFEFNDAVPAGDPIPLSRLIGAMSVCLLIYVINLIDVILAVWRVKKGKG